MIVPVPTADGDETPALVSREVHTHHLHGGADHGRSEGEASLVLEPLPERGELLVVAVGVDGHPFDQLVGHVSHGAAP